MKTSTAKILTSVSMEFIHAVTMRSASILKAIIRVLVIRDFTEMASTVLMSMNATQETLI